MIETLTSPFQAMLNQPIEHVFHLVVATSAVAFISAAFMREFFTDPYVRWTGRFLGFGAFFFLVCFAQYATEQTAKAQQFAHKAKNVNVSQIGFAIKTQAGNEFIPGAMIDGVRRTTTDLRSGFGSDRYDDGCIGCLRRESSGRTAAIGLGTSSRAHAGDSGLYAFGSVLAEQWRSSGSNRSSGASSGDDTAADF